LLHGLHFIGPMYRRCVTGPANWRGACRSRPSTHWHTKRSAVVVPDVMPIVAAVTMLPSRVTLRDGDVAAA